MKVYDKASWHIDAGEEKKIVLARFDAIISFLKSKELLNDNGKEIADLGIDDSISLNDSMLTEKGNRFIEVLIDSIIDKSPEEIKTELEESFNTKHKRNDDSYVLNEENLKLKAQILKMQQVIDEVRITNKKLQASNKELELVNKELLRKNEQLENNISELKKMIGKL